MRGLGANLKHTIVRNPGGHAMGGVAFGRVTNYCGTVAVCLAMPLVSIPENRCVPVFSE